MDPIFLGRLALRLGIPIGELGARMSAHELCVFWPAFFEVEQRMQEREQQHQEQLNMRRGR